MPSRNIALKSYQQKKTINPTTFWSEFHFFRAHPLPHPHGCKQGMIDSHWSLWEIYDYTIENILNGDIDILNGRCGCRTHSSEMRR